MIGIDTSVVVRYLVGMPEAQAARAAALVDEEGVDLGVSVVALAECAHVLRTQYQVEQRDIVDALIDFVQRENVRVVDAQPDLLVAMLLRARSMPGGPIPDALIFAAAAAAGSVPLATFDRDQQRYGIDVRAP
ncbi:MAG: PIN domain-containing protein [Candidatus Limnocylindrales bacterium]